MLILILSIKEKILNNPKNILKRLPSEEWSVFTEGKELVFLVKYFGIIPFPEFKDMFPFFVHFYFFKKKKVDAGGNQENASCYTHQVFVCLQLFKKRSEEIDKQNHGNIAGRNTENKSEAALVSVVEALLDDGK